jgi:hypothetical protein
MPARWIKRERISRAFPTRTKTKTVDDGRGASPMARKPSINADRSPRSRTRLSVTKSCSAAAAMVAAWVAAPVLHAGRKRSSLAAKAGVAMRAPTRAPGIA